MSETTVIDTNEKPYELRDLKSEDMFPMFGILSKIGFKEFKSCFESDSVKSMIAGMAGNAEGEEETDASDVVAAIGISVVLDIAGIVMSNLPKCKNEIYTFLSGLSGMSKSELADLDMVVFTEMIVDVVKKDQFKDFIKVVSKLFN